MFVKKMRQKFQDRLADAGTLAEENISSIRTVRSFAGENKASSLYGDEVQKSYEVGKKLAIAYGKFTFDIESFSPSFLKFENKQFIHIYDIIRVQHNCQ